ITSGIGVLPV
nr:Chain C, ILE-THR-SER-GLY-ILE-GLY-VAL-LEU-PRO-VAL [Homo sapiens]6G3K_F Chain F, ILE-THR-SER-GLY-ILE-GLY-VAL-LEU-PRO-VAL [Homo sapiens]